MDEKSYDDLDDAVIVPQPPEMLRAIARSGKRSAGFLQIPAQVMARIELYPVSLPAWGVLCVLQRLEFKAEHKGEPLKLTNKAIELFGISRHLKLQALDELVAREFILPYDRNHKSAPRVRLNTRLQK